MFDTVVLDGGGQLNIDQGVDLQVVSGSAKGSVTIASDGTADLTLDTAAEMSLELDTAGEFGLVTEVISGELPYYTGATEVTPSTSAQTLITGNTIVLSNITINPIPSNYGLITWNGSTLTVS